MFYSYLVAKRSLDDTVGFSCNSVVDWCGYKPNYRKDKINDRVKEFFTELDKHNYFKQADISSINKNYFTEVKLNIDKFDAPSQFSLVYLCEIEKIKNRSIKNTKMTAPILLLILSYVRLNMLRREVEYKGKLSNKPEFCYRMYKDIEEDIGISSRYISSGIKILEQLDIITTKTLPRYKDESGNWHTSVTLFVDKYRYRRNKHNQYVLDKEYDYNQELQWGEEYISEKKYLKKGFYQDTEGGK